MSKQIYGTLGNLVRFNDDSRFLSCILKVCHDGDNVNKTNFAKEDMLRCAEQSLRECPILGSVVVDEDTGEKRLNGHDMETELVETDEGYQLKVNHIERIYGFIPHDAKVWAEYDVEKEKTYILTNGVLWANYLDDVEDILNKKDGETDISMEITVDDSTMGMNGIENIKDFRFLGITMLHDRPAMEGANLKLANFQMDELKTSLQEMMKMYAIEMEGGENMDKDKVVESEVKEEVFEEVPSEPVEDEFACDPKKKRNCEEEEDMACNPKKKRNCEEEEDDKKKDEEDMACKKKKYEELEEKYSALEKSYAELEAKLESMADYAELKAFKDAYDAEQYKAKVDAISKEFGLAEKDFKDIREKAYAKEISLENYEEKLALISYRQNAKKNFGAEKEKNEAMIIDSTDTEEISIYGELDKYFK